MLSSGSSSQTFRPGVLSAQLSGLPSPHMIGSSSGFLSTVKSQSGLMFGSTLSRAAVEQDFTQQLQRQALKSLKPCRLNQNKVFNYENQSDKNAGTLSGGFDLQPQYSLHSPFRNQEQRKDFQNQMAQGKQQDSAVRENEILSSIGSQGFELYSTQLTQLRERSDLSKDSKKNAFAKRKGSSDSQNRQGRFASQGKSDQKRGKSTSNSQSRQKASNDQRTAGLNYNQTRPLQKEASALRRPNSAKNLKQVPSMANMQRTLLTSPTQQTLIREPSQNYLPPKPKPLRNSTMAKLPLGLYQSVGSLPTQGNQTNSQNSGSTSKRAPSASSERRSNNQTSKVNAQYTSSSLGYHQEPNAFSPVRRNHHMTQPTSNTKHSGNKGISRSKKKDKHQFSQKKLQSPVQNLHNAELLNLQNLSPNIGRVNPNQVINEEYKEDSWTKEQLHSFDASEIQAKQGLTGLDQQESQDSSLNLKFHNQTTKRNRPLNENALSQELFKSIKQQIQIGITEDEKKRKSKLIMKKASEKQPIKKFNLDLMKQELAQRMEGKMLAKKAKKPLQTINDVQAKELELQLKQKKQQAKEQWQKEKEERHECIELVKEAFKQPIKNTSTSLTRKREASKSQQRPFSAKPTHEQLLVKVPPVQEDLSPTDNYDALHSQELSPKMQQRYEAQTDKQADFLRKQKREKSKRKKKEENVDSQNQAKKENALKILQEQCTKKFESYKNAFQASQKTKMKKHKNVKSHKHLDQAKDNVQPKRTNQHRSKSKRRVDDEKENRRLSISPSKEAVQPKEVRSGTKSRSDKKRKSRAHQHQITEAQFLALQNNVFELLSKQKPSESDHQRKPSLTKKSQTMKNLHQDLRLSGGLPKNQIIISKAQLKSIMALKKSAKSSQSQSHEEMAFKSSKDQSFTHIQAPESQQLDKMMESEEYRHIFVSEQHQELTPIIEQKGKGIQHKINIRDSNDFKYSQGIRPVDSLTSFKPSTLKKQFPSVLQSQEEMTLFKSQDKLEEQLQQPIVQINLQLDNAQENVFKSRSGSIHNAQKHQNSQKRKTSSKKLKDHEVISPTKQSSHEQRTHGSGSKTRKTFSNRKGSAGFKRNPVPLAAHPPTLISTQKLRNSHTQLNLRPKSAAIEKVNVMDILHQQQQLSKVNEQEQAFRQLLNFASVFVQKHLKGYLARKLVHQMLQEKLQVDRDLLLVQQKYLTKDQSSLRQSQESLNRKHSPIGQILPDLDGDMNYSSKIDILNEESKVSKGGEYGLDHSRQSSQLNSFSKLSKSEANLKNIIAVEHDKLKKHSRPSSSDISKKLVKKKKSDSLRSSITVDKESQKHSEKNPSLVLVLEEEKVQEPMTQKHQVSNPIEIINQSKERKSTFDYEKQSNGNDSRRDSFLKNLMNESFHKSHHRKSSFSKDHHSKRNDVKKVAATSQQVLSGSQILGSEDRDISWQQDRKSLQDLFDHNSQILKEESKRQSIGAIQDSASKKALQSKLQYEAYLNDMEKKTLHGKNELRRLNEKRMLSPASQKRKLHLEKWVSVQEQIISDKKKWVAANLNDFISKMDQEFQKTKQILGSSRHSSIKFNTSHDWSQHDMSLGHITSSSIHSTPRIIGSGSLTGTHQQQQQNAIISNLSAFANNKSERGFDQVIKPKKLFDYQIPLKSDDQKSKESKTSMDSKLQSKKSEYEASQKEEPKQLIEPEEIKLEFKDDGDSNIFTQNMLDQEKSSPQKSEKRELEIVASIHHDEDEDGEGESLSKMEPPQFQSPTISAMSQNQNVKDYLSDEEEKNAPVPSPPFSNNKTKIDLPFEELKSEPKINQFQSQEAEQEYSDAFLALKEPEHPISLEDVKKLQDNQEERNIQTEVLTDYILTILLEQMSFNMFPKRAPFKQVDDAQCQDHHQHSVEDEDVKDASDSAPSADPIQVEPQPSQIVQLPKKKRVRGIKTQMRVVDGYMGQIFQRVKEQEDEFIENLSTPLNKDPLEILLHLQNAFLDNEIENAVAFQQSVLPVDLYLDIERNKPDVQAQDDESDDEEVNTNKSMMGEWENIHNKVIFDGINEALDNFRPYGLRGPPMPWSQQTRTLTYKNGQQVDLVMRQVRVKVMEWARTFAGALPCSELLQEYGIKGPLEEDKLNMLREERLALVLAAEIEENEMLWTDYEYEETQTKLDVADMILEVLADEAVAELTKIQQSRQLSQADTTVNTSTGNNVLQRE